MWRMAWVSPLPGADLNGSILAAGHQRTFRLPGQNKERQSLVRINPTWALTGKEPRSFTKTPLPVFYISLRQPEKPFEDLRPINNRIAIYTSHAEQLANSYQSSVLHAELAAAGEEFRSEIKYGIVVRVNSIDASASGSANITVCRIGSLKESSSDGSCSDGRDNDCDGSPAFTSASAAFAAAAASTDSTDSAAAAAESAATAALVA
ncbi:hypothetical protein PLESTF_000524100 [Pleodorina starrii]|nr:hypothetical protein PLESTM_000187300 [Pleodorina starrii]GLC67164.1 hypothetical protein PLESTF_000524100 [Pleodorina starrii]